jgi:hypothetical protein
MSFCSKGKTLRKCKISGPHGHEYEHGWMSSGIQHLVADDGGSRFPEMSVSIYRSTRGNTSEEGGKYSNMNCR